MSGHRSSRRREYGRRQKDVRARRVETPAIDLDGPSLWARGRAWGDAADAGDRSMAPRQLDDQRSTADHGTRSQGR